MAGDSSLKQLLVESALSEGFLLAGVVDVDKVDLAPHVTRYDDWLRSGYSGDMQYLVRGRDRRADVRQVFPSAMSVLSVAVPYARQPAGTQGGARYARYLQGPDYHLDLEDK